MYFLRNIVCMYAIKVEVMELELQTEEKDSEISSDLFEHKQEDLNNLGKKIDLVDGMV